MARARRTTTRKATRKSAKATTGKTPKTTRKQAGKPTPAGRGEMKRADHGKPVEGFFARQAGTVGDILGSCAP